MRQNENGEWVYNDGTLISENPSEEEITSHYDEYVQYLSIEQAQLLEKLRDSKILSVFRQMSQGMNEDQAIDLAIQFWYEQYPREVQPFLRDMALLRQTLYDPKGFSSDKDKSMLLIGRMPDRIKAFLLTHNVNFFERDKNGRSKNLDKFYSRFKVGKVQQ